VDRDHNIPGTPTLPADVQMLERSQRLMTHAPYRLDRVRRRSVLEGIRQCCERRNWALLAPHVRTEHVHVVLDITVPPEAAMGALKAYASRAINETGVDRRGKRWARHGSTRRLRSRLAVENAINYVIASQGQPMEMFVAGQGPLAGARGSVG